MERENIHNGFFELNGMDVFDDKYEGMILPPPEGYTEDTGEEDRRRA